MLARNIVSDRKMHEAMIALMLLKPAAITALVLSLFTVALFVFFLIIDAAYEICTQLAQLWAECNAVEKLLFACLAWAFLAWAWKQVKGYLHAGK